MYKPVSKLYELSFVDYPGLEVTARSASIGQIRAAQEMSISTKNEDPEKALEAFKFFEKKIVSWNVVHPEIEDPNEEGKCPLCGLAEDDAIPPTLTGMQCLDIGMMTTIMFGWIQTVARVTVPKELSSNGGGTNGLGSPPTDGIAEETMRKLAEMQRPTTLPIPNLSSD